MACALCGTPSAQQFCIRCLPRRPFAGTLLSVLRAVQPHIQTRSYGAALTTLDEHYGSHAGSVHGPGKPSTFHRDRIRLDKLAYSSRYYTDEDQWHSMLDLLVWFETHKGTPDIAARMRNFEPIPIGADHGRPVGQGWVRVHSGSRARQGYTGSTRAEIRVRQGYTRSMGTMEAGKYIYPITFFPTNQRL